MKKIKMIALMLGVAMSLFVSEAKAVKIKGNILNNDMCFVTVMYKDNGVWEGYEIGADIVDFFLKLSDDYEYKILFEGEYQTKVLRIKKGAGKGVTLIVDIDFSNEDECQEVLIRKGFLNIREIKEVLC
jgi:diphthamide synthase (EF-2-diphthine--ammonia ligase)